ncbi:SpoVR family protein [Dethiosulfatarculus sandiegensis]|uniref:SpoVR family protein n=1 Tax=Dethiosulfatarculus sandiegensis TaxID=1429043 RepID=A0A0D2K2U7_9BACT|nr:SpoVR family protein [Dethiosulfatarculus sandiegensis]KIX15935.1 SpoVR family protein [Dethiosulfatarculus sandiegensis]
MELIDQHTKKVMEGCKERARQAGLDFHDETLEYIVSNRDLLELSPKMMIPTLYDYWVHDVEVLKERGKYELYPVNPYETVINTRPAISFYNDNNPDWLNVMIFYHVLAHIDLFQNNLFYRGTWDYDFTGRALSDKRLIARLRSQKGRWVDYVIEFARGVDNLVGYYHQLGLLQEAVIKNGNERLDYYFDVFLQAGGEISVSEYVEKVEKYNQCKREHGELGEEVFFDEIKKKHPEFEASFEKYKRGKRISRLDPMEFIMEYSPFLAKKENRWMKPVLEVVRNTSLFFQPQIRTKILNEGWASYWHEVLFLKDDRIKGNEVNFARVNAYVTSLPRVGLNPYALGMRLFSHIKEYGDKGKISLDFDRLKDSKSRDEYDKKLGQGMDCIFQIRENMCDFTFIQKFVDQDFVDKYKLFVSGKRLNRTKMVWEYYVKSRNAKDYREMLIDGLYHPPKIEVMPEKAKEGAIYLNHRFEGKPLVKDFIANTMIGLEFLWGGPVQLETSEVAPPTIPSAGNLPTGVNIPGQAKSKEKIIWQRVLYTMDKKKLSRKVVG